MEREANQRKEREMEESAGHPQAIEKIRSKADAERFVREIGSVAHRDELLEAYTGEKRLLFVFSEGSGPYHWERVTLYIYPDGTWESYYEASDGTYSQAPSLVDDPVGLIWRERKHINAAIERINDSYRDDPLRAR